MTNSSQIQETILKAIDAVVTQRNNELKLDKTITGIIKKNIGKRGGKTIYQVEYAGGIIEAVTQKENDVYTPHTGVYVLVQQGDFSKEKIIIGRTSSIQTDRSASVIAAAINKYSIIGSNLLESTSSTKIQDLKYGLRSFHPSFRDDTHGIEHRAQFIYWNDRENNDIIFNNTKLNLYKEEATALMVKADFLTNLDRIQKEQPNARYGLIFNFVFDNLNKGYGETNKEIFESVSDIIGSRSVLTTRVNNNGQTIEELQSVTLKDYISENLIEPLNNTFSGMSVQRFIADNDGYIDKCIDMTQSIYNTFQIDDAKLNTEIVQNTIQSFLALLEELKYKDSVEELSNRWIEWCADPVGDAAQKTIQFVLTSDDMIGNPFSFNTWNTQYSIFNIDLETFNHLESILFYKEGFYEDSEDTHYENMWPIGTNGDSDIFVKNLQVYAMNPLDAQSGDYSLKVEPYAGLDIILSNDPSTGYENKTQFRAILLRQFYENLTANSKVNYLWFKEDSFVINANSKHYNVYAGAGWRELEHNETNYLFTTTIEDNKAYKNNYKCVAIYEPSIDDKVILSYTFSVYNRDVLLDIKLESDLGTKFGFDAGAPTVTVLINEDRTDKTSEFKEYPGITLQPIYKYIWTIDDIANNYVLFLNEINSYTSELEADPTDAIIMTSKKNLLKKIKTYWYDTDEQLEANRLKEIDNPEKATRVKYPVSISSEGFSITCYVQKKQDNGQYYDIGSASLLFENSREETISECRIHIVNGDQVFQYDEYGNTPCAKKNKNPLEIQPLNAKILNRSGVEIEGTNFQVEWIFPIEDTMIVPLNQLQVNPSTNLMQSYKGHELSFDIAELYDPNAYANQITCHVTFDGKDYYKDTNFYFGKQGSNGTNGTDVVAKIEYNGNDPANILHYQPLTMYVQKQTDTAMFNVGGSNTNPEIIIANTQMNDAGLIQSGILKVNLYQKNNLLDFTPYDKINWNIAGNPNANINMIGKFFNINITENTSQLIWKYNYKYNDIEKNNNYRVQNLKASIKLKDKEQEYYAFISLPIIEYETTLLNSLLVSNRIAIDKNYYLNEIVYNADGRNPVYNHNQGLKLYNIPNSITKIVWTACGGWDVSIGDLETHPCFLLLEEKDGQDASRRIVTGNIENKEAMVYVLPQDTYSGSVTNNYIKAELFNDNRIVATVYAPINMTLNTFGLASLNAWDGNTVTIDEEGGYIMAPQIGAGEKDKNNRFTGVLMGKTETYTGKASNEKETGLFGYAHGLQSIFLDANTGNADFGLPDGYTFNEKSGTLVPDSEGDDYNEGRIELRPGAMSKVGGWRLGRRSIYYTLQNNISWYEKDDGEPDIRRYVEFSGEIGEKYKQDQETPLNKQYADHHEKDIKYQEHGILLSAGPPYLSIKGQPLSFTEISKDDNGNLKVGDAIEMQFDPQTPTVFTIFRHNGKLRGEALEKKRTFLAGINAKGQLKANAVGTAGDAATQTTMYVGNTRAFLDGHDRDNSGDVDINEDGPSYHGGIFESGTTSDSVPFFRAFISQKDAGGWDVDENGERIGTNNFNQQGMLHIDGGRRLNNQYVRPISIHGAQLYLYAEPGNYTNVEDTIQETTDSNIKLERLRAEIELGENTLLSLHRGEEKNNLKTQGKFNWHVGLFKNNDENTLFTNTVNFIEDNGKPSMEDCNPQDLTISNNNFKHYNFGDIDIKSQGNYNVTSWKDNINFTLNRWNGSDNLKYSYLNLTHDSVELGTPNETTLNSSILRLNNISNPDNPTYLKTINSHVLIETNTQAESQAPNSSEPYKIQILSQGVGTATVGSYPDKPQIELRAGLLHQAGNTNSSYTRMTLNTSNNNWTKDNRGLLDGNEEQEYWKYQSGGTGNEGVPFEVAVKSAPLKGQDNKEEEARAYGSISIRTNTIAIDSKNSPYKRTRFYKFLVHMSEKVIGGLEVNGGINTVPGLTEYGIWSENHIGTNKDLVAQQDIYACRKYYGKQQDSFADGDGTSGQETSISGLNDSGTGTFATITRDAQNGRLQLGSKSISVTMPTTEDIWNAVSSKVGEVIRTALTDYAKKTDLDNCMKIGTSYQLDGYNIITSVSGTGITATQTPWLRVKG